MTRFFLSLALLLMVTQPACIWKLWSKEKNPEARIYDVYGTVKSVNQDRLVITTTKGDRGFVFTPSSIKGSDFGAGAYVHVYYKLQGGSEVITMVVQKID
ncbi:MAG: hypothetical protein HY645_01505 [Acidobacteria bacterium]|nr:hypothetical protein [Acidobacteriota bacterium]